MEPRQKLIRALFALSKEQEDEKVMREEWIPCERYVCEDPEGETCPCGKQHIRELCFIRNRKTGHKIFVGNECVRFFAEIGYCASCGLYPAVSHTAHYCEYCGHNRNDKPTGFVEKGNPLFGEKIVGLSYLSAYHRNPTYAAYLMENPQKWKYIDKHYIAFLKKHFAENGSVRGKRMEKSVEEGIVAR